MSRMVEAQIDDLAARQHGVITRAQILETGLSASALGRRLRQGRFRMVHRGVYLVGPRVSPYATEMAAVLAGGPGAVLSHLSAARLWELFEPSKPEHSAPLRGRADPRPVEIMIEGANRGRRAGIRAHRVVRLIPEERAERFGIPVTSPARTLIDLAEKVGSRETEQAIARAERKGFVDRTALARLVERHRGRPGIRLLRALVAGEGGPALTRSEAEARFLDLIRKSGLPPPSVNVRLGPYEIDFLWQSHRIAVEVDGFRYHSSRRRFEGDRKKDAWLVSRGFRVIRLSWDQVARQDLVTIAQVAQALGRADS